MKIVIDARMINESGIGRYIRNLIYQLQKQDKKNDYFILHLKDDYDRLVYHSNFHKILANFKWYGLSEQYQLPKLLSRIKANLVHFPHFSVPIFYNGKFVVTIHDLIHQHFSMKRVTTHGPLIYELKKFGYKKVFQYAIKKSLKIFTPSKFIKKQLIDEWEVDGDKVIVTPEAVDDKLFTIVNSLSSGQIASIMKKFNIKPPYLFYAGNAHPHKNVEGLIKTFLNLKEKYKDLLLVLSGYDHYFWQRIKKEYQDKDIVYTGYVTDEELVVLYKGAKAFVLPSFEEGFGIPILEAMACGCPVVSSDSGSLLEVGGDAAIYFNPLDTWNVSSKIAQVLDKPRLRKQLIEKGKKRVKLFSWERLTKQTLEVYKECMLQ